MYEYLKTIWLRRDDDGRMGARLTVKRSLVGDVVDE